MDDNYPYRAVYIPDNIFFSLKFILCRSLIDCYSHPLKIWLVEIPKRDKLAFVQVS